MAGAVERVFVAQPVVSAGQRVIASPFQFATTEDDNLQIVSANSLAGVVLAIQGRRVTNSGSIEPFAYVHVPNSDRSTKTENFKLGAGAVMNLTIFASTGSPQIGQTYVMARIIRGLTAATVVLGGLLGGYVTAAQALSYPGSPIQSSAEGGGYLRTITGTDPVAGQAATETVPTGARWFLRTCRINLATNAVAGNRQPILKFSNGVSVLFVSPSVATQPASRTDEYYWAAGMPLAAALTAQQNVMGLPVPAGLLAGEFLIVSVTGMDPGDNLTAPVYQVEERLEVQS